MAMFLGVDGGGTKTAFALIDCEGHVLAQHQQGSAYYLEVGMDGAAAVLQHGISETLAIAGISASDLQFAFLGLPAYGEDSALLSALDALPAAALPAGRYRCGNDVVCGWAGSLGCEDGISIVAGTGSIAYGEYGGRSARSGGWGELFSDEGSAYWIAREGLNAFSRMSDGRAEPGPMRRLFRERLKLTGDLDLCAEVYSRLGAERSAVAQLAQLVFDAALQDDGTAQAIFAKGARELARMVKAVRKSLAVPDYVTLPVSYSGGVFKSQSLVLAPFEQELQAHAARYALTRPRFTPVIGAALLAAARCEQPLDVQALARLSAQCEPAPAADHLPG
jgi:N-acetylglucosamine kinase-like BadF-type ATPase